MNISKDDKTVGELDKAIEHYAAALKELQEARSQPSHKQVMAVLCTRDTVQVALKALKQDDRSSAQSKAAIVELDSQLKTCEQAISSTRALPEWRKSLQPPESNWWWFFQQEKAIEPWDRFDWLWNSLTLGTLALSVSFLVALYQAFSIQGVTWERSFTTILQGAGVAAIGSGAFTKGGQRTVGKVLKKCGVPERFSSEATLGVSLLLLGMTYSWYRVIPGFLYRQGLKNYEQGILSEAEESFLQAIELDSENDQLYIALGQVYESTGDLENAIAQYNQAIPSGDPQAFNNLGRVYIDRIDPILRTRKLFLAETILRLGLQRAYSNEVEQDKTHQQLINVRYQLHRNLGWALLEQKKYLQAEAELNKAIALDNQIEEFQIGTSMSECLLTGLYQAIGNKKAELENFRDCRVYARLETFNEYKWLVQIGQNQLADCIDTDSIVGGLDKLPVEFSNSCKARALQLPPTALTDPAEIEILRERLEERIAEADRIDRHFDHDLVYWVSVGEGAAISVFEPTNRLASDYIQDTPIFALFDLNNIPETLAIFNVRFHPDGSFEVNLLSELEKSLGTSAPSLSEPPVTDLPKDDQ